MIRLSSSKNPITKSTESQGAIDITALVQEVLANLKNHGKKNGKMDKTPKSKTAPPTAQKLSCNVGHSIPDHPRHLHLSQTPTKDEIDDEIFIDLYRSLMFLHVFFSGDFWISLSSRLAPSFRARPMASQECFSQIFSDSEKLTGLCCQLFFQWQYMSDESSWNFITSNTSNMACLSTKLWAYSST